MTHRPILLLAIVVLVFVVACGSDDATTPKGNDGDGTTPGVGAKGGVVSSASGKGEVSIPPGAISGANVEVTVTEMDRSGYPDPGGRYSDVFEIGPDGTMFDIPVTVSLALQDTLADSTATLWTLNETADAWEEVPLSYTANGRVWGQTSHLSSFSAAPASSSNECTWRESIPLRIPGSVEVLVADLDVAHLIGEGTPGEQETASRWITHSRAIQVQGIAGPPGGQGMWIDYASGPPFETGVFDIDPASGTFDFVMEIPQIGFRYLALTDACLAPYATPENGWYYHLEVWCGNDCSDSGGPVPWCDFPEIVTMQPNSTWIESTFRFLESPQVCSLDGAPDLARVIVFRSYPSGDRTATVINGTHQWDILSSSHGTSIQPASVWTDLPDATDITFELRDRFDSQASVYRLRFRFDGDFFTIKSFVVQ